MQRQPSDVVSGFLTAVASATVVSRTTPSKHKGPESKSHSGPLYLVRAPRSALTD